MVPVEPEPVLPVDAVELTAAEEDPLELLAAVELVEPVELAADDAEPELAFPLDEDTAETLDVLEVPEELEAVEERVETPALAELAVPDDAVAEVRLEAVDEVPVVLLRLPPVELLEDELPEDELFEDDERDEAELEPVELEEDPSEVEATVEDEVLVDSDDEDTVDEPTELVARAWSWSMRC